MNTVKEGFTTKEKQSLKNNKLLSNSDCLGSIGTAAGVGIGLLVYFKKRKRQAAPR